MYKTMVKLMVRRNIAQLNAGDASGLLKMASPGVEIRFPGDNSWARMFRPVVKGRQAHATHRYSCAGDVDVTFVMVVLQPGDAGLVPPTSIAEAQPE